MFSVLNAVVLRSANAFAVLQVHALAGRVFQAGDDADGRSVLLGYGVPAARAARTDPRRV